ncbi:hypothetical protein D3C85_992380 [compost metagenome]
MVHVNGYVKIAKEALPLSVSIGQVSALSVYQCNLILGRIAAAPFIIVDDLFTNGPVHIQFQLLNFTHSNFVVKNNGFDLCRAIQRNSRLCI